MSSILYSVNLSQGCFSLPITQHENVGDDILTTSSPFEDDDRVVIVPMLEDKLYIYPLTIWEQLQHHNRITMQTITGFKSSTIDHTVQTVKNQTIQLDTSHIEHVGKSERLWFVAHENHVEISAIKPYDEEIIAQKRSARFLNKLNFYEMADAINELIDALKEQHSALDSLENFEQNESVERAIKLIALQACVDFKIPKVDRNHIVRQVICEVINRQLLNGLKPNPKLSVYWVARNICIKHVR